MVVRMSVVQIKTEKIIPLETPRRRRVTVLGSTGSVGCQTIDLISRAPENYKVVALTARKNIDKLIEQALLLKPELAVIADESKYDILKAALAGTNIAVAAGAQAVIEAAEA